MIVLKYTKTYEDCPIGCKGISYLNDDHEHKDCLVCGVKWNRITNKVIKDMKEVIEFLIKNGYKEDTENGNEFRSFFKDGLSGIDIDEKYISFVSDWGAWLYIPVNYYALIGALLHHRMLGTNYVP